jgi:thymidylate kinase
VPSLHGMAAEPQTSGPSLLSLVYQTIEKTGGLWLVLRGGEDSLYRGGDVDMLVEPAMLDQLENDLPLLGFSAVPSAGKGSHRFFLGYDDKTERWVRLDFVTRVDFGVHQELTTETASDLLHRRSRIENYWRLNDDDGFWYLFLHRYLGQRDLKPLELALLALRAREAGPLAELVDSIGKSHASSTDILGRARDREWYALEALRSEFQRKWRRRRPGALLTRLHYRADRLTHAVASISAPAGISITIIGPDGAGKTTLAEGLRETLPIPSRYVYMGVWREYPWDKWLRFIPGLRLLQRMVRLRFRTLEAWFHRVRGRIVLLDRFTYDVMLPSENLDNRGRITAWLVRKVCAEPHLVLVLNAPAELMWERKGEQGVEELERRRLSYLEMAEARDFSVIIDARQSVEDVRARAEEAVWLRLRRHWNRQA